MPGLDAADWWMASLIAAAVTVAAALPSTVSVQEAAGPGGGGVPVPDARQKATSPSRGVKAGSTALAIPAVATRATIPQPRLSSDASVQTQANVVFSPGRAAQRGSSELWWMRSALRTSSPLSACGPPRIVPSWSRTSPNALATAIAATGHAVGKGHGGVAHPARGGA